MDDTVVPEPFPEPAIPELVRPAFPCAVPDCVYEPSLLYFIGGRPFVFCRKHGEKQVSKYPELLEADLFQMPDEWRERLQRALRRLIERAEATEEQKHRSIATYQHSLDRARIGLQQAQKEQELYGALLSEIGE